MLCEPGPVSCKPLFLLLYHIIILQIIWKKEESVYFAEVNFNVGKRGS